MNSKYFYWLDNFRFLAFFLVFWQHSFAHSLHMFFPYSEGSYIKAFMDTGGIGVHLFFVLSGFLITFLLIKEHNSYGGINIKKFYIRRCLRIWPLYYLVMLLGIFILPNIFNTFQYCENPIYSLTFLNNFDMNLACYSPNIQIAWSVAIEEQFYLIWPIIFYFSFGNKYFPFLVFSILALGVLFTYQNPEVSYLHTFGNISYLMTGCIGAYFYSHLTPKHWSIIKNKFIFYTIFCLLIVLLIWNNGSSNNLLYTVVAPIIFLYFIIYLTKKEGNRYVKINQLGKYTYGMYMLHPMFIVLVKIIFDIFNFNYLENGWLQIILSTIALIATIIFSYISFEYFEKHFLKLKNKYG